MHRTAPRPLVAATPASSRARKVAFAALSLAVLLGTGLTGSASASGAEPGWGPLQEVPPFDQVHQLPRSGVFPDGTLVTVWEQDQTGAEDDLTNIFRSTRPPGGDWSMPEEFPVEGVRSLEGIATRADGSLLVSLSDGTTPAVIRYRVSRWSAAGTVDDTGATNRQDAYALSADSTADVVADRLGGKGKAKGSQHVVTYYNGERSYRLPKVGADPRDVFAPGPRDSVWMAGYDKSRSKLQVRRWKPGMSKWKTDWSRNYPGNHRKALVNGLDLAVGDAGRAILAFKERKIGKTGETIRAVRRKGRSGWAKPAILQRIASDNRLTMSAPVVAAAGDHAEVAWTSSASRLTGKREIRVAQMTDGPRDVRLLAKVTSLEGFEDLSLDVDVRDDGDVLLTYLQRRGSRRQLVGYLGPHDELESTMLLKDAGLMRGDSAFLIPGVAAVVSSVRSNHLASRVREE